MSGEGRALQSLFALVKSLSSYEVPGKIKSRRRGVIEVSVLCCVVEGLEF